MSTILHEPTDTAGAHLELLRSMLEETFAVHTARLTELTEYGRLPDHGGYEPHTLELLTMSHRQHVADAAQALRRMAEGTYGICEGCQHRIPVGRLHTAPHATLCAPCQPQPF
ncbi:TraR/DksA family transcriptional regulator [Actinoplanes aureus]|uniref:TraR/DksA C4-type zinc finger protein n=1 Tax=Actinoplanes aureus TaxID=2792083 RepID=A0A931CDY5_9ACTN|nr:TraR/DksA C4-type zinc finger protein [Actinoplanes aureus]MBG0564776.1 TraR/DksA C4-type zinc finger protein [Actinoplanes aureus]